MSIRFSMVEHHYFRNFLISLQPQLCVPCEKTIKKEILSMYDIVKVKIRKKIDGNIDRIDITTDMWTATTQKKGYMVVTTHYIDNNWHLRNHMLKPKK
ncbi:Putative AC transposase [Linum perenne]